MAQELRVRGGAERLVYTTHGWLAHLYVHCPAGMVLSGIKLACPSQADVSAFKASARRGDIVWQAGAFNTEYELAYNADMVDAQFQLSRELADELGVPRPRVLSLRDVPGTTRALIPLLARNNITALTVGVNNGAPNPAMPNPGRWVDTRSNTSVLFMQTGPGVGYPAREANHGGLCRKVCVTAPKLAHAMCWAFRPDNSGPPSSADEVVSYFDTARAAFPGAEVHASTHDRFVEQLETVAAELPVAVGEVGDTWATSQTADPWKWIFYREASRAYSECKAAGLCDPVADRRVSDFLRLLVKIPEHTGGPDNFDGGSSWTNAEFHADIAAKRPGIVAAERAYLEQRDIASVLGLHYLRDHPLRSNISRRMASDTSSPRVCVCLVWFKVWLILECTPSPNHCTLGPYFYADVRLHISLSLSLSLSMHIYIHTHTLMTSSICRPCYVLQCRTQPYWRRCRQQNGRPRCQPCRRTLAQYR